MPAKHSVFEKVGKKFSNQRISTRVRNMAVSAIKEMSLLAMEIPGTVSLAWGLPSFETPLGIRQKIAAALLSNPDIGKYAPPPGLPALKAKIAERLAREKGLAADPQTEILITAGGMQALMMTFLTILEPGDEVLLTSPGFSSHYEQITLASGEAVGVPLVEEQGWRLDIPSFRQAVTPKTRAIVIVNPANPTGTVFKEAELRELAALALERDLYLVTDDPYEVYMYGDQKKFYLRSIPEVRDRVISCSSFSKEFAMTGWRVGWVWAEEGILNQLLKVQDSFVICAPTISQVASLFALEGSYQPTLDMVEEMRQRRELICGRLDSLADLFSYQKPEGAYYIFPKVLPAAFQDSVEFCVRLMREAKVVAVPGNAFGPTGEGHVRMSYCMSREQINEGFDRITAWWAKQR
jgi:aminotransferase